LFGTTSWILNVTNVFPKRTVNTSLGFYELPSKFFVHHAETLLMFLKTSAAGIPVVMLA